MNSETFTSAMVSVLTFRFLLLLLSNVSVLDVSIMDCTWFSFLCLLESACLLQNLGSRLITELIILEKVLGLLAKETKIYSC